MITLLERRRIEAEFARALLAEMTRHLPRELALSVLAETVRGLAREAGRALADAQRRAADGAAAGGPAPPTEGTPGLLGLAQAIPLWQEGGALDIEWHERGSRRLSFDVTRCRYAEMYRELGIPELGELLSCNRDGEFGAGYDPDIALTRQDTIMQGSDRCRFRYTLRSEAPAQHADPRE